MNDDKFRKYCGLTCHGGSENKQCPCNGPADCEMKNHPQFDMYRKIATKRLMSGLRRDMFVSRLRHPEPKDKAVILFSCALVLLGSSSYLLRHGITGVDFGIGYFSIFMSGYAFRAALAWWHQK